MTFFASFPLSPCFLPIPHPIFSIELSPRSPPYKYRNSNPQNSAFNPASFVGPHTIGPTPLVSLLRLRFPRRVEVEAAHFVDFDEVSRVVR
jgi:hypothetical protein